MGRRKLPRGELKAEHPQAYMLRGLYDGGQYNTAKKLIAAMSPDARADMTEDLVSKWMTGRQPPKGIRLAELQRLLGFTSRQWLAWGEGRNLSFGGDSRPLLWQDVNHSQTVIKWRAVGERSNVDMLQAVMSKYLGARAAECTFDYLEEGTATRNFRVRGPQPFFLKLYVGELTREIIKDRHRLVKSIIDQGVFSPEHSSALVPIPIGGETLIDVRGLVYRDSSGGVVALINAELFPLIDAEVEHFSADSKDQLFSLAEKFGEVQLVVNGFPNLLDDHSPGSESYRITADKMKGRLKALDEIADEQAEAGKTPIAALWKEHSAYIGEALVRADGFLKRTQQTVGQFYHDMHPHNAFFLRSQCVLIYDYHRAGRFPHEEVVAYAIHRFVREYVRDQAKRYEKDGSDVGELIDRFLEAYQRRGLPLGAEFRGEIPGWIRVSSLRKLLSVTRKLIGEQADAEQRTKDELFSEAKKFLGFLYEADAFENFI